MVAAFAISGYAWTLRPVASEHAPGSPWAWQLARAAFAACAAVALVCLWVTHAADPGFIKPRCAYEKQLTPS
jgi:predicted small integral membrane protein